MIMSDYEEIQRLMAVYADAIDSKDYKAITDCFAPDATTTYAGYSGILRGSADIEAHMRAVLEQLDVSQHLFTNFIVDVDGDGACLRCDILAQHLRQGESFLAGGKYSVELQRIAGIWKIARLAAHTIWSEGNRAILPGTD